MSVQQSYSSTNQGTSWQSDGNLGAPLRMSIEATADPEPTTGIMCLTALGMGLLRRRK